MPSSIPFSISKHRGIPLYTVWVWAELKWAGRKRIIVKFDPVVILLNNWRKTKDKVLENLLFYFIFYFILRVAIKCQSGNGRETWSHFVFVFFFLWTWVGHTSTIYNNKNTENEWRRETATETNKKAKIQDYSWLIKKIKKMSSFPLRLNPILCCGYGGHDRLRCLFLPLLTFSAVCQLS